MKSIGDSSASLRISYFSWSVVKNLHLFSSQEKGAKLYGDYFKFLAFCLFIKLLCHFGFIMAERRIHGISLHI